MSKPIEEGCRAVIVGLPVNGGKKVTVGKFIGDVDRFNEGNIWEVDKPMINRHGAPVYHMAEAYLKRIDEDGEELSTWETVEADCLWNPTKIAVPHDS